ncbi:MAG: hypothetical protein ACK4OM_01215 [Alphaproteobacteria bacterium]
MYFDNESIYDESIPLEKGEISLWRAVINQAFCDLRINSDAKAEYKVLRRKAAIWLTSNSKDFQIVCDYANLDPKYVKDKAMAVIEKISKTLKK